MNGRVRDKKIRIDNEAIKEFFADRSRRFDKANPLVSVLYQDNNPELAIERDLFEKKTLLPLLDPKTEDKALDIGCGIGRWAESLKDKVSLYCGIDLDEGLIQIARKHFVDAPHLRFETRSAQQVDADFLKALPQFDLVLIMGVLIYLNDDECVGLLNQISTSVSPGARILVRDPVGIAGRLTLDRIWSEELRHEYSAIYRSVSEIQAMLNEAFRSLGMGVTHNDALYPQLNNRVETQQHYFVVSL